MIKIRQSKSQDLLFLKKMLYEAVFWLDMESAPSFEEAFTLPFVQLVLEGWGSRPNDLALIATIDQEAVGAVWIRHFTSEKNTRGYINDQTPVLVIGVDRSYRKMGLGKQLIEALKIQAAEAGISRISLCVTKNNHAKKLYVRQGFEVYQDIGDSLLMTLDIENLKE